MITIAKVTVTVTPTTDSREASNEGRARNARPSSSLSAGQTLREAGLRARKSLGQNFLTDRTVPPRIALAADIRQADTVVEVGPGLGVLTEEIAARLDPSQGKLIAVELDDNLVPLLRDRFSSNPNIEVVHGDILEIPPEQLTGDRAYKVVANLPYYITSAVLRHFLDAAHKPLSLTVMVQREVAERMAASPPDMSLLSVAVQFYGKPKIAFRVPPGAFHPVPKVESAVVNIPLYPPDQRPVPPSEESRFFRIARAGFSQKRKQLANTLSTDLGLPKQEVIDLLQKAGVDPTRRAETLSLQDWAALAGEFPDLLGSSQEVV